MNKMDRTIQFKEACNWSKKLNCIEALPAALEVTNDTKPPDLSEATIICKLKVRENKESDICCFIDGSECPLGKIVKGITVGEDYEGRWNGQG